jgi:hypothetical protein
VQPKNPHDIAVAGYVEVANEPLHREIYADRYFRAYLATLSPGQATAFHRHSEDTLYVVIKGGNMRTTGFKGERRSSMVFPCSFPLYKKLWLALQNVFTGSADLPDGLSFFMPTREHPAIHMASASPRNRGDVCLMGIELHYGSAACPPLAQPALPWRLEYDHASFKVFTWRLAPAAAGKIVLPGYHLFVVCIKGLLEIALEDAFREKSGVRRLAAGDYLCIPGDVPALAGSLGGAAAELIILALPADVQ